MHVQSSTTTTNTNTNHTTTRSVPVTAIRQERIPILFIATARAHQMAYKNHLRLSDLFQGFVVQPQQSITTNTTITATTTIPFRSATKLLHILMEQWQSSIQFMEEEHYVRMMRGSNTTTTSHATTNDTAAAATASEENDDDDDIRARTILQNATTLRPTDGNIQQELHVLEDTIDNLLSVSVHRGRHHDASSALEQGYTNHYTASSSTSTSQDFLQPEQEEHVYDQVVNDAYRLTSSLHIPWLIRYRQACDSCTNILTHDQFHCPAIIVFVATTMEHYDDDDNRQDRTTSNTAASRSSDIVATIRALQSNYHYWPVQYRNGMFDPTLVRREVLILHDNVESCRIYKTNIVIPTITSYRI